MTQLGEQQPGMLAQVAGQLLRSGRMVIRAITQKKEGGRQTSGSPIAPQSPGQAPAGRVADSLSKLETLQRGVAAASRIVAAAAVGDGGARQRRADREVQAADT